MITPMRPFLLIITIGWLWGQCGSCIGSNCLNSSQTGSWTSCNTWASSSFCSVWTTFQMNTRYPIINTSHTVTISGIISFNLQNCRSIYIRSGATLNIQSPYTGNTSGSYVLDVCGTLNIDLIGTANFSNFDLIVRSGGVVNINAGTLRVYRIVIESGGVINLNGGRLERQCLSSTTPGLDIQAGGILNINSSTAQLQVHSCLGTAYTRLHGTIDCKSSCTASSYGNFQLGKVIVNSGVSTGLIRTQTAYVPLSDLTRAADNNFWGWNSDYGGTVEYYGSTAVTLALYSRYEYYSLKVSCPQLALNTTTDVVGELDLSGGNLALNGKTLRIRGTIRYGTGRYLVGDNAARLEVVGKLSSPISPGLTTYLISSQGISGINCRNLPLRFGGGATGQSLKTLWLYREDAVQLQSLLDIYDTLNLETGILRTSATNLLTVRNSAPGAVLHHTTGWFTAYYGFVSGPLRRHIGSSGAYDFPVGYPNLTSYYVGWNSTQPQALHRRLRLEIQNQTGLSWIQAEFVPPVPDVCSGQLNITEADGTPHLQIHPEGYWRVQPNTNIYAIVYDVRAYTWGFAAPPLADNRYAVIKRPDGATLCSDWTRDSGLWPPADTLGRVIKVDASGRDTSYAHRLGWNSFSEFAIGITDAPLSQVAPLHLHIAAQKGPTYLLTAKGALAGERLSLSVFSGEVEAVEELREGEFQIRPRTPSAVYVESSTGRKSSLLFLMPPTWWVEGDRLILQKGAVRGWDLMGRLVGSWDKPGTWPLPAGLLYLTDAEGRRLRIQVEE